MRHRATGADAEEPLAQTPTHRWRRDRRAVGAHTQRHWRIISNCATGSPHHASGVSRAAAHQLDLNYALERAGAPHLRGEHHANARRSPRRRQASRSCSARHVVPGGHANPSTPGALSRAKVDGRGEGKVFRPIPIAPPPHRPRVVPQSRPHMAWNPRHVRRSPSRKEKPMSNPVTNLAQSIRRKVVWSLG